MCIEIFHRCKYCRDSYVCSFDDIFCPTINEDRDKNLCPKCRNLLEERLMTDDIDSKTKIEEILFGEDE